VILFEATSRLGESIVGGNVSSDSYKIDGNGKIVNVLVSNKTKVRIRDHTPDTTIKLDIPHDKAIAQALTREEILKLVEFGLMLERYYDRPQDIEFAIE
jgi:pyruvate,water dikinase